jgi:hypothetical protein
MQPSARRSILSWGAIITFVLLAPLPIFAFTFTAPWIASNVSNAGFYFDSSDTLNITTPLPYSPTNPPYTSQTVSITLQSTIQLSAGESIIAIVPRYGYASAASETFTVTVGSMMADSSQATGLPNNQFTNNGSGTLTATVTVTFSVSGMYISASPIASLQFYNP